MTTIYRLEKDGLGPFSRLGLPFEIANKRDWRIVGSKNCVNADGLPVKFKKGDNCKYFIYGCTDIQGLVNYLGYLFMHTLQKYGFEIVEYQIKNSRVRYSPDGKQVAFYVGQDNILMRKMSVR